MKKHTVTITLSDYSTITLTLQKDIAKNSFSAFHSSGNPDFKYDLLESDRADYEKAKQFLLSL